MLRLFLQNYEIELTEDIQVAITKQFEDITNPTSIINDWSKTVKIPATSQNNKIFGHLNNVDRLTVSGSGSIGVYFDPYKKIDFRLQWGDAIVMTGYAKNVSCDKDYYNLTLNGELGKVFQEMKKITFDKTTDDTKYLIDGSQYIDEIINKDLVYRLWNNEPDFENLNLIDKYIWAINATTGEKIKQINGAYKTQNYLGFAPNNSFEADFDYKTFQKYDQNTSMKLSEVLDERVQGLENNTEATSSLFLTKYQEVSYDANLTGTEMYRYMVPLIRLSEVYLIAAEGAPTREEALGYINTVRAHRSCRNLEGDNFDLQETITAEFAREVIGEGQLFYYYKRLGMEQMISGTAASGTYGMVLSNYVMPLPSSETDKRVM
jgi:hypothetical protein